MDSKIDNVVRNVFWGFGAKIMNIFLPFLTRTILLRQMGIEFAGASGLFTSVLNVLNITELGFGSALVYAMYKPMADNDTEEICKLLNYYRKCYRIIGLITLVLGFMFMPFISYLVKGSVPEGLSLQGVYLIYLINSVIGYFLFAYKQSLFLASQQVHVTSRVAMVTTVLLNILQSLSLIFIQNYYVYVLIIPITTAFHNIIIGVAGKKTFPEYVCRGRISKEVNEQMTKRVMGLMMQKTGNVVLKSVDTIVISSFLGLAVLGVYNGYYYVLTAIESFISVMNSSLIPSVGNTLISCDRESAHKLYHKIHFVYFCVITIFSTCLLTLFQPFITLWQGEQNTLSFGVVVLIVISFYIHHINDVAYVFSDALGLWWKARWVHLAAALVNLIINIMLVNFIGMFGIVISTIISLILGYHICYTRILFMEYFKSVKRWLGYLLNLVAYFIVALIIVGITYVTGSHFLCYGIMGLMIGLISSTLISCALLWVIFHRTEQYKYLVGLLKGYKKKLLKDKRGNK